MGSSKDSQLALKTLGMLLDGAIKAQDMAVVGASVSGSSLQNKELVNFI